MELEIKSSLQRDCLAGIFRDFAFKQHPNHQGPGSVQLVKAPSCQVSVNAQHGKDPRPWADGMNSLDQRKSEVV